MHFLPKCLSFHFKYLFEVTVNQHTNSRSNSGETPVIPRRPPQRKHLEELEPCQSYHKCWRHHTQDISDITWLPHQACVERDFPLSQPISYHHPVLCFCEFVFSALWEAQSPAEEGFGLAFLFQCILWRFITACANNSFLFILEWYSGVPVCISTHLLKNNWVVPNAWLLQMMVFWGFVWSLLCEQKSLVSLG